MKKKMLYILGAILLVLIITNPSVKSFKDYLGHENELGLSHTTNFFVCSIYVNMGNSAEYLGVVGNFYQIDGPTAVADSAKAFDNLKIVDSAKMGPDTSVKHK